MSDAIPYYQQTKDPATGEWLKVNVTTGEVAKRRAEMWKTLRFTDAFMAKTMAEIRDCREAKVARIRGHIAVSAALKS